MFFPVFSRVPDDDVHIQNCDDNDVKPPCQLSRNDDVELNFTVRIGGKNRVN